jgi:hypothetical protein
MTATAEVIENQLRELPLDDLMAIYASCLTTIHKREEAESLDLDFCREIERRVAEIDSGAARGIEAFQALREM